MIYFYLAIIVIVVIAMCYVIYMACLVCILNTQASYKILYTPESWSPPLSVVPGDHKCMGNFIHSPCCHACPIMGDCQERSPVRKFIAGEKDEKLIKNHEECCVPVCHFGTYDGNDFKSI